GRSYVFRVAGNVLQRAEVTLDRRVGDLQVISSGLNAGDQVVVRDVAALSDGQRINVGKAE
ncbi:MAG: efflux transporter periplasmic adaptor subunit, partial [Pseudomonadota bacterium]|nr:efflux transporter periplasmic adaptor subunit [Pseudomonadota bacterium]